MIHGEQFETISDHNPDLSCAYVPETGSSHKAEFGWKDDNIMASFASKLLAGAISEADATTEPIWRTVRHSTEFSARNAVYAQWPQWVDSDIQHAITARGIDRLWSHQVDAAQLAYEGRHVVISTATASGKSLAFQLPIMTALAQNPRARALYIAPTKALGHDQLRTAHELVAAVGRLADVAPTSYDGDSSAQVRAFARERSRWLFSNPDMIHLSMLRHHERWAVFLRHLRYLVIDECHHYRGIFGSHVAMVLRRLLRLCDRYRADSTPGPTVIFTSATIAAPGQTAAMLIGATVAEVSNDGSPQQARVIALAEPELRVDICGENGAPVRHSAGMYAASMMADLVARGVQTVTFVRSRRGAELTALAARERLNDIAPEMSHTVASYRAGYLVEDRRALERALVDGQLRGLATTNALELGIDISGLDAVLMAGFPGSIASFWQQAGRAGRRGRGALVIFIARDDPLDTYLVNHPEALLNRPSEHIVMDPTNPWVVRPQLLCAAMELPLNDAELRRWEVESVATELVDDGLLRRRGDKYFPAVGLDPHPAVDIRGCAGDQVAIVEDGTGRLLGSTSAGQAPANVHPGAVYLHQGQTYVVDSLSLEEGVAFVHQHDPGYTTYARKVTSINVTGHGDRVRYNTVTMGVVPVNVQHQVVGFLRRATSGEVLDFIELDMPEQYLCTTAVMYTIEPHALRNKGIEVSKIPGSLHAAEHAAIGLLPLVASCDRGDIGGLSTMNGDQGLPTVFVYDGHPGGAGFAQRGYLLAEQWLNATIETIQACGCPQGCPSCVQSPHCGSGNDPLDKAGAIIVLQHVVTELQTGCPTL